MAAWWERVKTAYRALTYADFVNKGIVAGRTAAGVPVTQHSAYNIAAYWNGVTIIAGNLGVLDRVLYRRVGEDDRERATTHPVFRLVHDNPNPDMTAMDFWQTLVSHALTWGNGYAEIEWDNAMRPIALWTIPPDEIEPQVDSLVDSRGRRTSKLWYRYRGRDRIEAEDIFHLRGLGFDGVKGYSVVTMARQSLGLTIAAERFGATFFGEGAWAGVALQHPRKLPPEVQQRLRDSINEMHQGPDRAHRVIVLEDGMTASRPITIPPDDAQFLETRTLQIEEIARWLNLPPHKLKHKMGERPGGNLEASQIDFLTDTLLPWAIRIEQEAKRKLIPKAQRATYYVEHLFAKIMRADATTRATVQRAYFDMGVLTAEQIARQENLPRPEPRQEPRPDAPPLPPPEPTPAPADPPVAPPAGQTSAAERAVCIDAVTRFMRRESEKAKRAARRGPEEFERWASDFYSREVEILTDYLTPAVWLRMASVGCSGGFARAARGVAEAYVERSRAELLALPAKEIAAEVPRLVDRWAVTRAVEVADQIMALRAQEESLAS